MRVILKVKEVGFSLEEIRDILSIKLSGETPCGCVREKIIRKVEEIEKLIEDLQSRKRLLMDLIRKEGHGAPAVVCPIIESIG